MNPAPGATNLIPSPTKTSTVLVVSEQYGSTGSWTHGTAQHRDAIRFCTILTGIVLALALVLTLPGCLDSRPRQESAQQPIQISLPKAEPDGRIDGLGKSLGDMRSELQASSNANQNTITGLGANISKVAEKVQGFGGDLLRIENSVNAKLEANLTAQANLKADLSADLSASLKAELQATISAQAQLTAKLSDLSARIDALAAAQVGLNNSIQQMSQTVSAGRDSIVQTTQYSKEVMETVINGQNTAYWIVIGFATMVIAGVKIMAVLGYRSKDRDRAYDQETIRLLVGKKGAGNAENSAAKL